MEAHMSENHKVTRPCPNCSLGEGLKTYNSVGFGGYTWPSIVEHCEICQIMGLPQCQERIWLGSESICLVYSL